MSAIDTSMFIENDMKKETTGGVIWMINSIIINIILIVLSHDILKYICDYLNMHCDNRDNAYSNYHKYILICHVTVCLMFKIYYG